MYFSIRTCAIHSFGLEGASPRLVSSSEEQDPVSQSDSSKVATLPTLETGALFFYLPIHLYFCLRGKNRFFLLWREGLLRARGLGARLLVVCPSVADTLLAASFCSPLKQHRQQLHPLTLLVRLDGRCLATVLMGAASVAATGEPDVVAALMQAENMRPNAWCMLTSWVNGSARPLQTTLARQSQVHVISLFLQWGRETRQQAHSLMQSECVWVWSVQTESCTRIKKCSARFQEQKKKKKVI